METDSNIKKTDRESEGQTYMERKERKRTDREIDNPTDGATKR